MEFNSNYNKIISTPLFIAALFTKLSYDSGQDAPLLINGLTKCGIYIQILFSHKE
jgi:hypothetical protein